jgi:hypothetical protein
MHSPTPTRTGWFAPRGAFPHGPTTPPPDGLAAIYRRRAPTATPFYSIVQHPLETFLADAAAADSHGEGVPRWVEDDFRAYLRCGILAHGFARIRCDACAAERLVAFSCKGRGICPSCNACRMVEVAAHLTDHVLPPLPGCPWVLASRCAAMEWSVRIVERPAQVWTAWAASMSIRVPPSCLAGRCVRWKRACTPGYRRPRTAASRDCVSGDGSISRSARIRTANR